MHAQVATMTLVSRRISRASAHVGFSESDGMENKFLEFVQQYDKTAGRTSLGMRENVLKRSIEPCGPS